MNRLSNAYFDWGRLILHKQIRLDSLIDVGYRDRNLCGPNEEWLRWTQSAGQKIGSS
jgi:hypothetical protein